MRPGRIQAIVLDGPHRAETGYQRVWMALVSQAIMIARDRTRDARVQDARCWIAGATAPLPFVDVCAALDLDAEAVRATVPRPRHEQMRHVACRECGGLFLPYHGLQVYCCLKHRRRAQSRRHARRDARHNHHRKVA